MSRIGALTVLVACISLQLAAGCNCVAGGRQIMGYVSSAVMPLNPAAQLCTDPEGGTCVDGTVEGDWETGSLMVSVTQIGSAGGDQLNECNDKPFVVITADNCVRYVEDDDLHTGSDSGREFPLECD